MCGICGAVSAERDRPIEARLMEAMLARLAHRGPDGQGLVMGRGAALGHSRLAIIDLSEAASQPLPNEDGTILAVVNGEIYNHRELRERLQANGHRFRSRSDCEVVVHQYEERGTALAEGLEGMFAFAIWDARNETLVLGRDRLGEKPLYYCETARGIVFASTIGALLADPDLVASADETAIHHYLTYRCVPSPWTGLRGVRKLPPGHLLIWERGRGAARVEAGTSSRLRRYAAVPRAQEARAELAAGGAPLAEQLSPQRLRQAIGRAVASRLESDVPIGVLLSGGIDSAIVALEAARVAGPSLRTFTVGFGEADYDESEEAALVARHIGSEHVALRVRPDLASELPLMVAHYGEPFGDSSAAAVWLLAREVRRHVTVALGGDGGDELFGGYDRHRAVRLSATLGRCGAGPLLRLASGALSALPFARRRRSVLSRLERFARMAALDAWAANGAWLAHFSAGDKRGLYTASFAQAVGSGDSLDLLSGSEAAASPGDVLDDVLHADLALLLPDDLLFKVDVASMASGLEVRAPFLDSALVRLAMAIPPARKIGWRRGKTILREAYAGLLPAATLGARKRGFGLPVDRWLRGPLREMTHDLLLGPRFNARGWFDRVAVARLLEEHETGRANHDDRIWMLLCLELWLRMVIEARAAATTTAAAASAAGVRT